MRIRAGAVGQRHQILFPDDRFDVLEPLAVVRQDGIADELLLLECADDLAVVTGLQAARCGDLRRQPLHLALDLGEGLVRQPGERFWRESDTHLFELERIQVCREAKIGSRLRQDLRPYELLVTW